MIFASKIFIAIVTQRMFGEVRYDHLLVQYISPLMLVAAIALFLTFVKTDFKPTARKMIQRFSPAAFGVYLIHCQPFIFRWCTDRFAFLARQSPVMMTLSAMGISVLIYVSCISVDMIRLFFFQKLKIKNAVSSFERKYLIVFASKE